MKTFEEYEKLIHNARKTFLFANYPRYVYPDALVIHYEFKELLIQYYKIYMTDEMQFMGMRCIFSADLKEDEVYCIQTKFTY